MIVDQKELTPSRIKAMFVHRDDPFVLEIGAHHGEDSKQFLAVFGNCRLHVFEADPRCIVKLREAVGRHPRCTVHAVAVASESGLMEWYQSGGSPDGKRQDWDYSSSLLKPAAHLEHYPWCTFERKTQVQVVALDRLMFGAIDFIWMDVQGAEHLVLRGAVETLKRTHFLYTEYYDIPMYEGQMNLDGLKGMLPDFAVAGLFGQGVGTNVLFENRRWIDTRATAEEA